jgi:hypothetical protein
MGKRRRFDANRGRSGDVSVFHVVALHFLVGDVIDAVEPHDATDASLLIDLRSQGRTLLPAARRLREAAVGGAADQLTAAQNTASASGPSGMLV